MDYTLGTNKLVVGGQKETETSQIFTFRTHIYLKYCSREKITEIDIFILIYFQVF